MMKNINWKKFTCAAMAAAMAPAIVAPIATEASEIRGLHNGWNIKVTLDGQPANYLFAEKQIYLVGQKDKKVYKQQSGKIWVPSGQIYDIYDVTKTKKGQIEVYQNGNTTIGKVNYKSVYETNTINILDTKEWLASESNAYYQNDSNRGVGIKGIYHSPAAKILVNGEVKTAENSISAHSPATIKYDLTGKNAKRFTGLVGFDERRDMGSIQVNVLVDGELHSSFVQSKGDNAKDLDIDLTNAETLEFVVKGNTAAENPNKHAMFVLENGKFYTQVKKVK